MNCDLADRDLLSLQDLLAMDSKEIEQKIFFVAEKKPKDKNHIFVQIKCSKFQRDNESMMMLQIINISDSILYS